MKSPAMEKFLEELAGRTTAQSSKTCIREPIGCGKPITDFRDNISEKEYSISGLCQDCQDKIFTVVD